MHLKKLISSVILMVVSALTFLPALSPALAASTPTGLGTTLNYGFGLTVGENLLGLDTATLNQRLDDITSLHIGWLRFDINWGSVQKYNASTFDWSRIDTFVDAANARHLSLLAMIGYTPAWARPSNCTNTDRCPPADPAAFAAFAKAAVLRYSPKGLMKWEIWNEENQKGAWATGGSASAYAALLKPTFTAIKAAQPWGGVIIGGMSPAATVNGDIAPVDFLTQLYASGAKDYFNGVGFHPYSFPASPSNYQVWNAWSQMSQTPNNLRAVMTANGDSPKRIWMTEYGAPTGGPGVAATDGSVSNFAPGTDHVTEALQAQMITDSVTLVKGWTWAGPMFLYSYKDLGNNPNTIENFFGLIRYDGSTKPAYTTLRTLLQ